MNLILKDEIIFSTKVEPHSKIGIPTLEMFSDSFIQILTDGKEILKTNFEQIVQSKSVIGINESPYLLIRSYKSRYLPLYIIKLESTLTIKNYLFSPLRIKLFEYDPMKTELVFKDTMLDPKDSYIQNSLFHSKAGIIYVSFKIAGYNWSNNIIVWTVDETNLSRNKTFDLNLNGVNHEKCLKLKLLINDLHQFYIFSEAAIIDETGFDLYFENKPLKSSNFTSLPGAEANVIIPLLKFPLFWVNLSDEIRISKDGGYSHSVNLNHLGNSALQINGDCTIFPIEVIIHIDDLVLGIHFLLSLMFSIYTVDKNLGIQMNLIRCTPAYIIINQTPFYLALKEKIGNEEPRKVMKQFEAFGIPWEYAKE